MTERVILTEDEHSGGQITIIPLSNEALKLLRSARRGGLLWLLGCAAVWIVSAVGITVGSDQSLGPTAAGTSAFLLLGVIVAYLVSFRSMQDLRTGTMCRCDGFWEERLTALRGYDRYEAEFKLPTRKRRLVVLQKSTVADFRSHGVGTDWGPANGRIEYTRSSGMVIRFSRGHPSDGTTFDD